ncbi:MAG TPA: hypothetical protein VFF05_03660 [Rudaea sp.]|jgi:hypothetical protein|nr:hypothetical protein [Rudaea sp.]
MSEQELNFRDLAARLPASATAHVPPADLWPRIVATHLNRRRQRRWRRLAAGGGALVLVAALAITAGVWRHAATPTIDWQARAQALELQLDALPTPAASNPLAQLAESELAHLDGNLQAAYDRGAAPRDLDPLWQRRSELLDALLSVRRQQVLLSRI